MQRALIIGAGVGGTVAALAFQRGGWEPVVYEAYDHSAGLDQGVFLTVAVNGFDALRAVDAAGVVGELGFPTGRMHFASGRGKPLGSMPIGPVLDDGTKTRTMRRADLYSALYELAEARGVSFVHGKRLVAVEQDDEAITATFADGSTATGDVLIGADGLRSTTRALIDPSAAAPRYTGMGNVGGFSATDAVTFDGGDYTMIWGKRSFFGYTVAPGGEVWWFANPPAREAVSDAELRSISTEQRRRGLIELFAGDEGPAAEIIAATTGDILYGNQYEVPRVRHWQRGRMIIIGDAAHAVSPATGQGVSLACEDAVVLAQALRDAPDHRQAFAAYEQARRARVERVVKWGARMGGTKTAGPVGRAMLDLILPRVFATAGSPKAMERQAWMFGHHIDWDAARPVPAKA
jgi:2-polyprenyl-6-methoxyphenol hydroxylase-like FAD-dependent oxidoreductase